MEIAGPTVPGTAKRAAKRTKVNHRSAEAIELRKAGWTNEEIAANLGYSSANAVSSDISATLRRVTYSAAEEYRNLNLERLEVGIRAIWEKYVAGDYAAIDRVIKLIDREAKLLGLDPQQATLNIDNRTQVMNIPEGAPLSLLQEIAAMKRSDE